MGKIKYYNSIDNCPALLFFQISEGKKDVTALCKKGLADEHEAIKAWDSIYSEFINEFGVSQEYKHYIRLKSELCEMIEQLIDGAKWMKMPIQIKKTDIANLENSLFKSDSNFNKTIAMLSKKMGFAIDPSKLTLRMFYSYIKD